MTAEPGQQAAAALARALDAAPGPAGEPREIEIAGEPGTGRTRTLSRLAEHARLHGLTVRWNPVRMPPEAGGAVVCLDDGAGRPTALEPGSWGGHGGLLVVARTVLPEHPVADGAERIDLAPLDRAAFDEMLGSRTLAERGALLYRLTGGVPGWARALAPLPDAELRALARDGLFPGPAPAGAREPSGLTPAEREVARAAAVLGDVFHPAQAAAVAGRDLDSVLPVLDALAERGVVRAVSAAVPFLRFRHPLLRAVLYARTPPGARIAAHARAARVLRAAGAAAVDRAPHLARSAAPGDLPAVRTLAEAADRVLDTQPARAAEWLRAARRILPAEAEAAALRRRVLNALWQAAERTGDHRQRRDLLPELDHLGGPADAVTSIALHARLATDLGRHRQAHDLLRTALRTADGAEAADLRRQLAVLAAVRGRLPTVRTLLAEDTGPDAAAVFALAGAIAGDDTVYRAQAAPAIAGLAGLAPADLAPRQHTVVRLGWAANLAERYPAAADLFARGVQAARETGWTGLLPRLLFGHGYALLALGRTAEALRALEDAEAAAADQDRADLARLARTVRTSALAWRDGPAPAVAGAPAADGVARLWWPVMDPGATLAGPAQPGDSAAGRRAAALCARAAEANDADASLLLSEAAAGFADRGMALWESHTRLLLSRRLAALDRLTEATAEAGRAKSLAVTAGSHWLRRLAVDRQRAIGARLPRQSAAAPRAALSVRESEIVRMVRAGRSNQDIAAALFVSVKTVEAHLTRIFRKTGARSRTALAAAPPLAAGSG